MKFKSRLLILSVIVMGLIPSCKKFIEIEPPKNSSTPGSVFKSDDLAISAMLGIYQQMSVSGYASGDANSISSLCGLLADEFISYNSTLAPFYQNQLIPENITVRSLWSSMYARIYNINALLEGLNSPQSTISPALSQQLQGEALFARAFNYFYLVSLFGDIPLHLSTDYKVNSIVKRTMVSEVYNQIIDDLRTAETKLSDNYINLERVRPNKATVQALMAKVFLNLKDWNNAEKYATIILENQNLYNLTELDQVFLKNSREAIWQLMPPANSNTPAGSLLILTTTPTTISLSPEFVGNYFDLNDKRRASWIKTIIVNGITYYYPFKYKVRSSSTISEYSMVFRIAEQFLIRAEARAEQANLAGAVDDIDMLRKRAGLVLIKNSNVSVTKDNIVKAIQNERTAELFSEWGNRWLDLSRSGKSAAILAPLKPNWISTKVLFPIPKAEIDNNNNITQNDGY